jgi:hypothetical protein
MRQALGHPSDVGEVPFGKFDQDASGPGRPGSFLVMPPVLPDQADWVGASSTGRAWSLIDGTSGRCRAQTCLPVVSATSCATAHISGRAASSGDA